MRIVISLTLGFITFGSVAAQANDSESHNRCFSSSQFEGWRAKDAKTIYIRANVDHYYRIDFARECATILWPYAQLILKSQAGSTMCSATDIQLRVAQGSRDIPQPCFVKAMTELSPTEAAALPKGLKP